MNEWDRSSEGLARVVWDQTDMCLNVYAEDPSRVQQDANNERRISQGGYATRQLEELAQNAVDAARQGGERIEILLTSEALYVANDGEPFSEQGVRSVMASDISTKDDTKIGKFGIGFKSLLAISNNPKVFSRTVSFTFEKLWAEETIREWAEDQIESGDRRLVEEYRKILTLPHYPAMRLARTLDPIAEGAASDMHLQAMMKWASTVIVAPLSGSSDELSKRLNSFPSEFLLFSGHVREARIRNLADSASDAKRREANPADRTISQRRRDDGNIVLASGTKESHWVVVRTNHNPGRTALADAGHVAAREALEIQYALPIPPGTTLGSFWAYFPTNFETTLSGLVNAPWKLSDDRTGLLPGHFNIELLGTLPKLVAEAISHLARVGEGESALDVLPARGLESRNWADKYINQPIINHLRMVPSVPDATGALHVPNLLKWYSDAEPEWLDLWSQVDGAPLTEWVHPGLYTTAERRSKLERLMSADGLARSDASESSAGVSAWLEALTRPKTVEASAAAIRLAAFVFNDSRRKPEVHKRVVEGLARAKIILLENGEMKAPSKGKVFVRVEGQDQPGVDYVHSELTKLAGIPEHLRALGVVVMDRSGELRRLIAHVRSGSPRGEGSDGSHWPAIWTVLRDLPSETGLKILRDDFDTHVLSAVVKVRTAAGRWVTPAEAYLPGRIVPADGRRDREMLIDPAFHARDGEYLREIGAVEAPVWQRMPPEPWQARFEQAAKDAFVRKATGSKPDPSKILVDGSSIAAWPLEPLIKMSGEARAAATEHLLAHGIPNHWSVRHASNSSYGRLTVLAPDAWFLQHYAILRTSFGLLQPGRVLRASDTIDPRALPAYEATDTVAHVLGLREDMDDFTANDWVRLKTIADSWTRPEDDERRQLFYAWLLWYLEPETLVVRVGSSCQSVALKNIGVTDDPSVYEAMVAAQVPGFLVKTQEDFDQLVDARGMPRGKDLLQEEIIIEPSGEAVYLTDVFPPLKMHLGASDQDLLLQPVTRLEKMIATPRGQMARPMKARRDGDTLLVTATEPVQRLLQISSELNLGLDQQGILAILKQMETAATHKLRATIKAAGSEDEKLVVAVGEEALRRTVPVQALQVLDQSTGGASGVEVAALARAVHGVGILKQLRRPLDEAGLLPPKEWAGRQMTRQWVASLGFPLEWAGFPTTNRAAVEIVEGPVNLSKLHDYQQFTTERIAALLRGIGPERGIVSLPTGAGKTRVTVQALVDAVRNDDVPLDAPLIWIAQTDELCEQAVETWTYVWRAIGPAIAMRLSRLWGNNDVTEEPGAFQLIVATIDKLDEIQRRSDDRYRWLREPSVVVIDEAHGSIAASYTRVLDWLGRATRGRDKNVRKPLIGLTATPFRGTSQVETERLVGRYDGNRLDRGAFLKEDPYEELQAMGVLAQVRHKLLDGTDVTLTESDISQIEKMRALPPAVSERLGSDLERTLRVVDSIVELPDDWTVLAFAPSVENSRVLAALLEHQGVPAVSISADTDAAARRHYIEEFKAGRVRVLTNFNVLTQGFDAPQVQAVYVARPTFSPNVYQQMIGRGLRGPLNGGSEEVLIVNVQDNFQKYGDLLAFNEFDYLWTRR